MELIQMRQATNLSRGKGRTFFSPLLIFVLVAALLATGLTLVLSRPEETKSPTLQEVVIANATRAAETKTYALTIEESGPGYNLRFVGQVQNGKIYGKIDAYDLEVFSNYNKYFVKGSKLFDEWQEVKLAELDALPVLIRDPQQLLQLLLADNKLLVEEGVERMVEDIPCQTYFLEIPPPDLQLLTRFEEEATVDRLQLYLWFGNDDTFLHRMAILINLTVNEQAIQINRIYNLSPQTKIFPEGLPEVDEGIKAI